MASYVPATKSDGLDGGHALNKRDDLRSGHFTADLADVDYASLAGYDAASAH